MILVLLYIITHFRLSGIKFLKRWLRTRPEDANPCTDNYCEDMSKPSAFVDALMLNTLAQRLNHDIVLVHMHADSVDNGLYNWIFGGGQLGDGVPANACPLFLSINTQISHCLHFISVYFEEGYYRAGHFQSIIPFRNSEILESIKQEGGFDVAEFLDFEDNHGEFNTVLLRSIDFILSFNEFSFFIVRGLVSSDERGTHKIHLNTVLFHKMQEDERTIILENSEDRIIIAFILFVRC